MSYLVKIIIADTNIYFAEGVRSLLTYHLNNHGMSVLFINDLNHLPFADLAFISLEMLPVFNSNNMYHNMPQKNVLLTSNLNLVTVPRGIGWFFHRSHTQRDLLELTDVILDIKYSDVDKYDISQSVSSSMERLTKREEQVIILISKGISHARISKIMNIKTKTVSSHKRNAMKKFNLSNTIDLHFWIAHNILYSTIQNNCISSFIL